MSYVEWAYFLIEPFNFFVANKLDKVIIFVPLIIFFVHVLISSSINPCVSERYVTKILRFSRIEDLIFSVSGVFYVNNNLCPVICFSIYFKMSYLSVKIYSFYFV